MQRGGAFCAIAEIQTPRCMVGASHRGTASSSVGGAHMSPKETDEMINRKPLYLALALTLAAPLAFAQSTTPQSATPQSTDAQAQQAAQQTTQSTETQATQPLTRRRRRRSRP